MRQASEEMRNAASELRREDPELFVKRHAPGLWRHCQERLKRHRTDLIDMTRRLGWSFLVHHTDRPPEEAVLSIHTRLAGLERDYRYRVPRPVAAGDKQADQLP